MKLAYYPRNSLIHSLDPRAKLLFVFIFFAAILLVENIGTYVLISFLIIFPFLFSKLPLKRVIKGFIPFLVLFILTFILHFFMTPGEILLKLGSLNGTLEGIYKGSFYSVRLFLLVLCTMLFGLTTSPIDFADSLSGFFHLFRSKTIREIPLIMVFVLRFIPFMFEEAEKAVMTQKARCGYIRFGRDLFSLIFPVIHSSIRRAEQLAQGLHAKAYEVGGKRTIINEFYFSFKDYMFICYSLLSFLLVFLFD